MAERAGTGEPLDRGGPRSAVKSPDGVRGVAVTGKLEPDIVRQSTTTQPSTGRGL